jgi:hypothetical protein
MDDLRRLTDLLTRAIVALAVHINVYKSPCTFIHVHDGSWGISFKTYSPQVRVANSTAGMSMVYFGNSDCFYNGITQDDAIAMFNGDGVGVNAALIPVTRNADYSNTANPLNINQDVTLEVGKTYRLQFMQAAEDMQAYGLPAPTPDGLAALKISVGFVVHSACSYSKVPSTRPWLVPDDSMHLV